jgi:hypothetical protein
MESEGDGYEVQAVWSQREMGMRSRLYGVRGSLRVQKDDIVKTEILHSVQM